MHHPQLLESFQTSYPALVFPPLPQRGDFDLQKVLESPYFFNWYSKQDWQLMPVFIVLLMQKSIIEFSGEVHPKLDWKLEQEKGACGCFCKGWQGQKLDVHGVSGKSCWDSFLIWWLRSYNRLVVDWRIICSVWSWKGKSPIHWNLPCWKFCILLQLIFSRGRKRKM